MLASVREWFAANPALHAATAAAAAVLLAGVVAALLGAPRVLRLVLAESIKVVSHRFLYFAVLILVAAILLLAWLQTSLAEAKGTDWGRPNTHQIFAYGAKPGLVIASLILVAFSSMLFAGEFDRGTIKNLLTRPVTRTDVFLAKVIVGVLLSLFLYFVVVYVSFAFGASFGDLGPVWDTQQYEMKRTAAQMDGYFRKTVLVGYLPLLGACCLGILISNLMESSGYAAVAAILVYLVLYPVSWYLPRHEPSFFIYYLTGPVDILQRYAEGEGTLGYEPGHIVPWFRDRLYLKVPFLTMAGLLAPAYAIFRWKNIHA